MTDWLWVVLTLVAAAAQTARNSLQKDLAGTIGTVGATHVRFLFGLPFAVVFLLVLCLAVQVVPQVTPAYLGWAAAGGLAQVFATGMMLAAMRSRSFAVTIAYTKVEPVLVFLFSVVVLSELPTPVAVAGVFVTTAGVVAMSWPRDRTDLGRWSTIALGLGSGALFGLSSVLYRGGILALPEGPFVVTASVALCTALAFQTVAITLYLALFDRPVLVSILGAWRRSVPAGFAGAFASQCWFLAFAIQSASLVRALALVEVLFAQVVGRHHFRQRTTAREIGGMALVVAGAAMILLAS